MKSDGVKAENIAHRSDLAPPCAILNGCLMTEPPDVARLHAADSVPEMAGEFAGKAASVNWLPYVLPSDNQRADTTCVLRSIAGNVEALARRRGESIPRGQQIGVRPIYDAIVRSVYGGHDPGGLYPDDGVRGCIEAGMLPPGTYLRHHKSLGAVMAALNSAPLLACLWTTPGWANIQRNGYLDPLAGSRTHLTGHCVLLLGILEDRGEPYVLLQDWQGPREGWHGCLIMHWRAYVATRHSQGASMLVRPPGTEAHDGWRKLLVDREEG